MRAVETSNTWLTRPPDSEDMNDASNRTGVAQWAWKTELSSPVKPMNNTLRSYIPCLMLPLIFMDILLHVSKPDPAPVVERAPARSLHETSQVYPPVALVVSYSSSELALPGQIELGGTTARMPLLLQPEYWQFVDCTRSAWSRQKDRSVEVLERHEDREPPQECYPKPGSRRPRFVTVYAGECRHCNCVFSFFFKPLFRAMSIFPGKVGPHT
jgi:hypothetical protein